MRMLSGFEAEGIFLDDGIGEDFARDAIDLGVGVGLGERRSEAKDEVFALADVVDTLIAHAGESLGDGFSLGVEDGALQRDIDMSLHRD